MTSILEPIHLEYGDGIKLLVSPRFHSMSVSYALGEFDTRELANDELEALFDTTLPERWAYLCWAATLASRRTCAIMRATNVIRPGTQVYWCDRILTEQKAFYKTIMSVLTSVAIPDNIPMEKVLDLLHKTNIPTSVINAELERIAHVRWYVNNHGEPQCPALGITSSSDSVQTSSIPATVTLGPLVTR